jgi:hypothetical protein
MKCFVLVPNKLGSVPLVECGGVTLSPDQKIIVKEDMANRLLKIYRPRIAKAGECDMIALRSGEYQVVGQETKLVELHPENEQKTTPTVETISANRSMESPEAQIRVKRRSKK